MSATKRMLDEPTRLERQLEASVAMVQARKVERTVAVPTAIHFSEEQRKLILDTCCGGASEAEARVLMAIAEARGMNPIAQECYFVKRWDKAKGGWVWAVQAGIDSFRAKAEETGLYDGQDEPEFEYDAKGNVKLARVRVYRKDWSRPCVGVARWEEYVQTTKEGSPTRFWANMPHNQLAKCAESAALRKAFPKVFARIYSPEEMQQADNGLEDRIPFPTDGAGDRRTGKLAGALPYDVDETTGEVTGPGAEEGRSFQTTRQALEQHIAKADTLQDLAAAWRAVNRAIKAATVKLEDGPELLRLKDARKAAIQAKQQAGAGAELDAMGPMAPGWGSSSDIRVDDHGPDKGQDRTDWSNAPREREPGEEG